MPIMPISKKRISIFLSCIIIACSLYLVFALSTILVAFDVGFYSREFAKYDVYGSLKGYDIEAINKEVLYFLEDEGELPNGFFSQRETTHLNDVKGVFRLIFRTAIIASLLLSASLAAIFLKENKISALNLLARLSMGIAVLIAIIDALLFFSVMLNFDLSFEAFHGIFFTQGSYLFDASYEKIVVLYPSGLFYDAPIQIARYSLMAALVLGLGGAAVHLLTRKKHIAVQ